MSNTVEQDSGKSGEALLFRRRKELLDKYLSLIPSRRRNLFAPTTFTAERFGIPQRTLQGWIEAGVVLALRFGRNYKVYVPSVEEYLRGRSRSER
ncbi:MAG: hypothetical protein JXA73_21750 [Acidobacteria bacterium]|nr:hypothetical protein [Acidobacteriota bacterium]